MSSIGGRVLARLRETRPDTPHREVAAEVGMTPDAFSRSLNDKRAFSSLELAALADLLGADLHWLITGTPDPQLMRVAARHDFDHVTGERTVPGRADDQRHLDDVGLAYRQAFTSPSPAPPTPALPAAPDAVRIALGDGFVRPFADRLEAQLGVDVVRVPELSTAYSFVLAGRAVVCIPATANWFRENWDLAHELGHLAAGDHDSCTDPGAFARTEAAANAFAADLLLPADELRAVDWSAVTPADLAERVWAWGVSTLALATRVSALRLPTGDVLAEWRESPTQRLLRQHGGPLAREITARMDGAAQRRFPAWLAEAHLDGIAAGRLGRDTLAWMLGTDPDDLDVDAPAPAAVEPDDLAAALGL